ncbi:MAG: TetR family transcriptional regulator [Clostridiales bacterium]|nr:TetR family transcriptional regulator [Clostridiales bacterium]MBQ2155219.1 TetR family transcriptional regulator [Clostridiales bacterium]MBQ5519970.1 TetR family transcriptional regulator [Clostridiales bacterium]
MQKDVKLGITKDKLIDATFELMEEADDPLNVTSRQIAERAGTKPSMINYCFGSRENLIYQTFQKQYLDFLKEEPIAELIASDISPKELLKKLHFIVAKCLVENPKFTKAISPFVLFERDLSKESFSFPYVKKHYAGRKTDRECRLIAYELSSMMQLMICRKDDLKRDFGIDLNNDKELKKYIDMRVDLLLA